MGAGRRGPALGRRPAAPASSARKATPGPTAAGPVADPEATGPEPVGPGVAGPGVAGPEPAGPRVAGPGVVGSGVAGSEAAGHGVAGSGPPGAGAADLRLGGDGRVGEDGGRGFPESGDRRRHLVAFAVLVAGLVAAALGALALGSVRLAPGEVVAALVSPESVDRGAVAVVRTVRLPRTGAAILVGSALAVSGLQMQTVFRNPLADPYVLGVTSGAGFGVALVVLAASSGTAAWLGGLAAVGRFGIAGAAFVGGFATTLVTLAVARRVRGVAAVLVVGLMAGYVLSALVSVLVAAADPQRLQQFVAWGLGSFRGITTAELQVLAPTVALGLAVATASAKPLNALLLGERYADSMGVPVRRARLVILASASLLAGVATAFAGPIAFVGVAVPHLARPLLRTSDHRLLLPACMLLGAIVALVAEVVAQLPGQAGILPLNAVTAILGAPVVAWVLVRRSRTEVVV